MTLFTFEAGKIVHRRLLLILLIATTFLFPILIKVGSHMNVVRDHVPEGLFVNNVAYAVITFSHFIVFIPVWMILLVGLEFSSGHVNRVAFTKSRGYFFAAKLTYATIVTLLFSVLGIIAVWIATETSPFKYLHVPFTFYLQFFAQLFVASLAYCVLLLCLVYWVRSPMIAFVIYFVWSTVESLSYGVFKALYQTELKWLPFHFLATLYLRDGEPSTDNYYNPFLEGPTTVIAPLVMVATILFFTYRMFIRRNLQPLSD